MKESVLVFGKSFEYHFLAGWIKYNRLQRGICQEALAYGVCSTSHLSYFESGKKKLRGEIIEALLKKMDLHEIKGIERIGHIRQKLHRMLFEIEAINYEEAQKIYEEVYELEVVINMSPYNIEYKIYQLFYMTFVQKKDYEALKSDIAALDKVYTSLEDELKYQYMFISGRIINRYKDHKAGIERINSAIKLKDTLWANYILGCAYCFDDQPLEGTYYLEKALEGYERSGRYINAAWCQNYLGICFCYLKLYDKGEKHFEAALAGAEHFNMDKLFWHLYVNISYLHCCKGNYAESMLWSKKAIETGEDVLLPATNYIDACIMLGKNEEIYRMFCVYLRDEYKSSHYYNYLKYKYLLLYSYEDKFYDEVTKEILPYYEKLGKLDVVRDIKLQLIEFFERKRKYKEANKLYKELLQNFI